MGQYVIGVDGGGTKTRMLLGNLDGQILADFTTSGSNHQIVGLKCKIILEEGINELLKKANVNINEIKVVYLGLSGADIESDYVLYNDICKSIFKTVPFIVENDVWIAMRAGLPKNYGAVTVCGTGSNSAAVNNSGEKAVLRQLDYALGAYGGSQDIAIKAFHLAFRSNECTGEKTLLETELPKLFAYKKLEECIPFFYPIKTITSEELSEVTKLVFSLANKQDIVSQSLLSSHGEKIAYNLLGVMKQVKILEEAVPIVLAGTLLTIKDTYLIQSFTKTIHAHAPLAYFLESKFPPVVGAYLSALDYLNIKLNDTINLCMGW